MWMAVDCCGEKLYFTNTDRNTGFSLIEKSNLDGTNRSIFLNNTNQEPVSLAVDFTAVYWTDRVTKSLWKVDKDETAKKQVKFDANMNPSDYTMRIMTRFSAGDGNCTVMLGREMLNILEPLFSEISRIAATFS